jgi:hypothetical protein
VRGASPVAIGAFLPSVQFVMWRIAPATAEPVSPNVNPEFKNMNAITVAARLVASKFGGATALGHAIGHPALVNELNENGTAKLGLMTAVEMSDTANDDSILEAWAQRRNQMLIPLPMTATAGGDLTMHALSRLGKEFGDVVQEVCATCADDDVSENELARVEKQWSELVSVGRHLIAGLRAKHEASKPTALRVAA